MSRRNQAVPHLVSKSPGALAAIRDEMYAKDVVEFAPSVESEGGVHGLRITMGRGDVEVLLREMQHGGGYNQDICHAAREAWLEEWCS